MDFGEDGVHFKEGFKIIEAQQVKKQKTFQAAPAVTFVSSVIDISVVGRTHLKVCFALWLFFVVVAAFCIYRGLNPISLLYIYIGRIK